MSTLAFPAVGSHALVLQEVLCVYIICTYHTVGEVYHQLDLPSKKGLS